MQQVRHHQGFKFHIHKDRIHHHKGDILRQVIQEHTHNQGTHNQDTHKQEVSHQVHHHLTTQFTEGHLHLKIQGCMEQIMHLNQLGILADLNFQTKQSGVVL